MVNNKVLGILTIFVIVTALQGFGLVATSLAHVGSVTLSAHIAPNGCAEGGNAGSQGSGGNEGSGSGTDGGVGPSPPSAQPQTRISPGDAPAC
jgi:hypothetical protein